MSEVNCTLPEAITPALINILGRPCFMCGDIAEVLRKNGTQIRHKAEDEQAHVILFLLRFWADDPVNWADKATEEMNAMIERSKANGNG